MVCIRGIWVENFTRILHTKLYLHILVCIYWIATIFWRKSRNDRDFLSWMHTKWNNFNLVCMFLCFSGKFFDCLHTKVEKIILVCICFWFTGWILLKIHTIFSIKQIDMYKGDFLREVCWNFTYLIEKMHFGMYIQVCHAYLFFYLIWQLKK